MDRLTYRLEDQWGNPTDSIILKPYMRYQDEDTKKVLLNRLAYYEDMEEQDAMQMSKHLNPLERNELEKAMFGRGVDYETIQLILRDFDIRIKHLYEVVYSKDNT